MKTNTKLVIARNNICTSMKMWKEINCLFDLSGEYFTDNLENKITEEHFNLWFRASTDILKLKSLIIQLIEVNEAEAVRLKRSVDRSVTRSSRAQNRTITGIG